MKDQWPRLDKVRRSLPRLQRLGPAIAVNHRSVNEDWWWGIIAEHGGEISGRASSWPTIHQCCWSRQGGGSTTMIRSSWESTFPIVKIELFDIEWACWGPTINVDRQSVNKSVLVTGSWLWKPKGGWNMIGPEQWGHMSPLTQLHVNPRYMHTLPTWLVKWLGFWESRTLGL